jgi:hypothetical protein
MRLDRARFMDEGYLIIPGFLSPERVHELRAAYDIALERQKAIWARERGPNDPPGGQWETGNQPRMYLDAYDLIDRSNAAAVEAWVDDDALEVATQLLAIPEASVTELMLMCSPPAKDFGPTCWHRDVGTEMAPLAQLIDDVVENGPRYLQWNLPLYDDDVLWIVPKSHRIPDRPGEEDESRGSISTPLPDGMQVKLRAGDAVVYVNYIKHWGSNYSRKLRRTIHGGHSPFTYHRGAPYLPHLNAKTQAHFAAADLRTRRAEAMTELALRAALSRDFAAYATALEAIQPGIGPKGKLVLGIYLSKIASGIRHQHLRDIPENEWNDRFIGRHHSITLRWGRAFTERFSHAESAVLVERFADLDAALKNPELPGARKEGYAFTAVPGLSWEDLREAWSAEHASST